ncbi:MAG: DUF2059 domain-containing protein [Candidatus Sulfotelmatobacter sp.]
MRFKSLLGVCVISFCMGAGAQTTVSIAPDAASKEDVQKLFDVMASRDQMAQMMQKVFAQMRTLNRDEIKKRHPDITAAQLASMDRQSEELLKNFPLDEMLSDMIPVYQRHFTKTEIDSFTSFFSSPVGQKYLHEIPAVTAETMRAVYPKIQAQVDAALKRAEDKTDPPQK